jgi:hypothetical protein
MIRFGKRNRCTSWGEGGIEWTSSLLEVYFLFVQIIPLFSSRLSSFIQKLKEFGFSQERSEDYTITSSDPCFS